MIWKYYTRTFINYNGVRQEKSPTENRKTQKIEIKENDIVEIGFNSGTVKFKILQIKETVRKEQVEELYEIISE